MSGNCLMVLISRYETVLLYGAEHPREIWWGGEHLKRASEKGDFIESLAKEMKILADEIDLLLEEIPRITTIRLRGGDYSRLYGFEEILRQYYGDHKLAKLKWA